MIKKDIYNLYSHMGPDTVGCTVVKTKVLHLDDLSAGDTAVLYDTILRLIQDVRGYLQTSWPPLLVTERH